MRVSWQVFIWIILISGIACRPEKHRAEPAFPLAPVPGDSASVGTLKRLIDITYDQPEQCVADPDAFLRRAPSTGLSPEGRKYYLQLLVNIGFCLKDEGQVLSSIRFFEKGLEYYQEEHPDGIDLYDNLIKPLGNLYTRTGDFEKAAALQRFAIASAEQNGRISLLPSLYNNLAITFQQTQQTDSVLDACRKGLSFPVASDAVTALLYNSIARCQAGSGLVDSAELYNRKALSLFEGRSFRGDTTLWLAACWELNSTLAYSRNRMDEARQSIYKAIRLTEENFPSSKQREKAKLYAARARLLIAARDWTGAKADLDKTCYLFGLHSIDQSFPDNTVTDALRGLAAVYKGRQQDDSAILCYKRAIENDYLVQQFIVSKQSNYYNSSNSRVVLQEALLLLWKKYQAGDPAMQQARAMQMLWLTELSKGRQLLLEIERTRYWQPDSSQQKAMVQLRYLYEELASEKNQEKIAALTSQVHEIAFRFQLSENFFDHRFEMPDYSKFSSYIKDRSKQSSIISWLLADTGCYVITASQEAVTACFIPDSAMKALDIAGFTNTYFKAGPAAYDNDPQQYEQRAAHILETLVPGAAQLQPAGWILSPDGILYALPVDALVQQGRFLAEKKNIAYTYTLLLNERNAGEGIYHSPVAIFIKDRHDPPLPYLPYARKEKELVHQRFAGTVSDNEEATDAAFISAINTPAVIHVATHAIVDSIAQPYLALAQKLTLDKIQYITTRSPLVVLSACQTASGRLVTAEGMESLNKAFLSKGVKGVIAAQWPVNDASMPELVQAFYKELHKTHSAPAALAGAKRSFLEKAKGPYRNPWYWAPLGFTGSDVAIVIGQRPTTYWLMSGILLAAAGIAVLIVFVYRKNRRAGLHKKSPRHRREL